MFGSRNGRRWRGKFVYYAVSACFTSHITWYPGTHHFIQLAHLFWFKYPSCTLHVLVHFRYYYFMFFFRFKYVFAFSWLMFLGTTVCFKIFYKFSYSVSNISVLSYEAGEETMRYTRRGLRIFNQGSSLTFGGHLPLRTNIIYPNKRKCNSRRFITRKEGSETRTLMWG